MNPSLSTVDSLLNVLPSNPAILRNYHPTTNSRLNSIDLDGAKGRSSPSFNDSEPPSYFEVVGGAAFEMAQTQAGSNTSNNNRESRCQVNMRQASAQNGHHNKEFTAIGSGQNNRTTRNMNLAGSIYQQQQQSETPLPHSRTDRSYHQHKPSETYMVWSVFTTFYCVFIGIFALILSIQVRSLNRKGLYQKAYARSRAVWYLNISGLFFGIVYLAVGILLCLLPRV